MPTMFRVIKITTDNFRPNQPKGSAIIWEGTDINELSQKFPPSDIMGADQLGYAQIEDGMIHWTHVFEQQSGDGKWEQIPDPRTRLNPHLTEREHAIDDENRRLDPGGYEEDIDEDNYHDDEQFHAELRQELHDWKLLE